MNKERVSNKQPADTIGKVVKYFCNGRWHHPFFANMLNWSVAEGAISRFSIITDYKVINPSKELMERLEGDARLMKLAQ